MKTLGTLLLSSAVVWVAGCRASEQQRNASREKVTVVLAETFDKSEGLNWRLPPSARDEFVVIQGDIDVTILLPSGQSYTTLSKFTTVRRAEEIVTLVKVTPMATSGYFGEAVLELEQVLEGLGGGDAKAQANLQQLKQTLGEWGPFGRVGLNANIEEGISISAEIRPTSEQGKWFLSYSLASTKYYGPDAIYRGPSPLDSP